MGTFWPWVLGALVIVGLVGRLLDPEPQPKRKRNRASDAEWLVEDTDRRNLDAEDGAYYAAHNQHDHHV